MRKELYDDRFIRKYREEPISNIDMYAYLNRLTEFDEKVASIKTRQDNMLIIEKVNRNRTPKEIIA